MKGFSQSGQAFEPFNLLIGAVFALTVLVIIVSAVNYFENEKLRISEQRFYDGLATAVKSPNGETLVIEGIQFPRDGAFSAKSLGQSMGLGDGCIELADSGAAGFELDGSTIRVKEAVKADVFAKCFTGGSCEIDCRISFGKDFEAER